MKDINMIDEAVKNPQGEEEAPKKAAGVIKAASILIAASAFVVITLVIPKTYESTLNMRLSSIESQLQDGKYNDVKQVKASSAAVARVLDEKKLVLDCIDKEAYPVANILSAIKNNTPEGCTINSIEYDTKLLKVGLKVQSISSVAEFLLNMDRLNYLKLADSSNTLKVDKNGEYLFDFNVDGKGVN